MTDYFTSDLHLGDHDVILGLRGFNSVTEYNQMILENMLNIMKPGDRLFNLGDMTAGISITQDETLIREFNNVLAQNKIHTDIILGNHDIAHPMYGQLARRWAHTFNDLFYRVDTASQMNIAGQEVLLSHFPYEGELNGPDNFTQWRLRDCGKTIIHGHTHSSEKTSLSSTGSVQINVAVDAWNYMPVSKVDIDALIRQATYRGNHGG